MVAPNGDKTESMFKARGAPMQQAISISVNAGRKGLIALDNLGNNLRSHFSCNVSFSGSH